VVPWRFAVSANGVNRIRIADSYHQGLHPSSLIVLLTFSTLAVAVVHGPNICDMALVTEHTRSIVAADDSQQLVAFDMRFFCWSRPNLNAKGGSLAARVLT